MGSAQSIGASVRIAAVHFPELPLECAFSARLRLASLQDAAAPLDGRVLAVRSEAHGRRTLEAVSRLGRARGLSPGMTESEARARVAELEVEARAPSLELARLSVAAERLLAFGPVVEFCPPAMLFVEVGRSQRALARRVGEGDAALAEAIVEAMAEAGHRVSVAIARDPDTARTLAQQLSMRLARLEAPPPPPRRAKRRRAPARSSAPAPRVDEARSVDPPEIPPSRTLVVPPGEEARALKTLPLEALGWTDLASDPDGALRGRLQGALASLATLGVRDVGALARLPSAQLTARFKDAGALLARRARGQLARPLRPFTPPERLLEEVELDGATEDLEPVLFLLRRLFSRLEARLEARALAISGLCITLLVEPGLANPIDAAAPRSGLTQRRERLELRFAQPTRRTATFLAVARERLQGALPGAVRAVWVEALAPSADRGAQLELFSAHARRVEALGELVGRLQAALGEQAVFTPELVDTHRPEAAWRAVPFGVERALLEPPSPRPVQPAAEVLRPRVHEGAGPRSALPTIDIHLGVTSSGDIDATNLRKDVETSGPKRDVSPRAWPKPVKSPADSSCPEPWPLRPLELLETPEPASLLRSVAVEGATEDGVLLWRGQRHRVSRFWAHERLEVEWWTPSPVARDYAIAELADGRRLWIFRVPSGALAVHGLFD